MGYVVIEHFCDMQDGGRSYEIGDKYPRSGFIPSQARLDNLATGRNALGRPLIKAVFEEKKVAKAVVSTETAAKTTPTPKAPKKSGTRKKNN